MNIGIDILGGDYAPDEVILGVIKARKELDASIEFTLFGDEKRAKEIFDREGVDSNLFRYVHTTEAIEMGEHPSKSFAKKPNSSISLAFQSLAKGQIHGFASAGNTGAILVGAMHVIKTIPGVIRPCITAGIPRPDGKHTLLLDVGINPDCKPDVLYQYAVLGSIYTEQITGIPNPKIGLLNIGAEPEKGNLLTKGAHELMKGSKVFNFIGNIEGSDLFDFDKVDVVVCDGFVGNILLKTLESFYDLLRSRNLTDDYINGYESDNFGGTPILGINSNIIIAHGASKAKAIANMIKTTANVTKAGLAEKINQFFV